MAFSPTSSIQRVLVNLALASLLAGVSAAQAPEEVVKDIGQRVQELFGVPEDGLAERIKRILEEEERLELFNACRSMFFHVDNFMPMGVACFFNALAGTCSKLTISPRRTSSSESFSRQIGRAVLPRLNILMRRPLTESLTAPIPTGHRRTLCGHTALQDEFAIRLTWGRQRDDNAISARIAYSILCLGDQTSL